MLTPKVAADIENWLGTSEGRQFAEKVRARLDAMDHPETLVKIGPWTELLPFKNFLQRTYNRAQRPGELKGCLERVEGIRVTGPVGQEVAGVVTQGDVYWSKYVATNGVETEKTIRSWEDYFQLNDQNCFFGVIHVKPSNENPGNTWVTIEDCIDSTGEIPGYNFACKDEKTKGIEDGSLVLGRRNLRFQDRPSFFAGDRVPVEIVDWNELKIPGTAREFFARKDRERVRIDCKCYFNDILVVDNDLVYSGMRYWKESGEVTVEDEWREGDVKKFEASCISVGA